MGQGGCSQCERNAGHAQLDVPEIFKFSYYANLVTDDVIGCASALV